MGDPARELYLELGHTVDLVPPVAGLPDMVYAANGALSMNGYSYRVQFTHPNAPPRPTPTRTCSTVAGLGPVQPRGVHQRG